MVFSSESTSSLLSCWLSASPPAFCAASGEPMSTRGAGGPAPGCGGGPTGGRFGVAAAAPEVSSTVNVASGVAAPSGELSLPSGGLGGTGGRCTVFGTFSCSAVSAIPGGGAGMPPMTGGCSGSGSGGAGMFPVCGAYIGGCAPP